MRILSVTAQKPFSTGSGIYLTELVRVFRKKGIDQAVIAGIYKEDKSPFPDDNKFYPLYFRTPELPFPIPGMSDEMPYESTRYCDMTIEMQEQYKAAYIDLIDRAVDEFKPDVILCHHLYFLTSIVRERFPKHKVYGFCHNTDLRQMDKHGMQREFIKRNIAALDRVFAPQEAQALGVERIYGIKLSDITLVGVGYNSDIFYKAESKAYDGKCHMLFAGKIAEKKGVFSLLRALKRLNLPKDKLELVLAGGAGNQDEYEAIVKLAETVPYSVIFAGKLNQQQIAEAYRKADVFILPSFYDAIPLTTIEAMACGTELIVSELPGIRDFFDNNVKGGNITYIPLPDMNNGDEPVEDQLPLFEERLADAIREGAMRQARSFADVSALTWDTIADEVIKDIKIQE